MSAFISPPPFAGELAVIVVYLPLFRLVLDRRNERITRTTGQYTSTRYLVYSVVSGEIAGRETAEAYSCKRVVNSYTYACIVGRPPLSREHATVRCSASACFVAAICGPASTIHYPNTRKRQGFGTG